MARSEELVCEFVSVMSKVQDNYGSGEYATPKPNSGQAGMYGSFEITAKDEDDLPF